MNLDLQPSEIAIDTWTLYYIAPNGNSIAGKLTVTNRRLMFVPQHENNSLALSIYNRKGLISLEKSGIKNIETKKSLLSKKVLVTMADNSTHTFNYGMMNIEKLVSAIQSNQKSNNFTPSDLKNDFK
ncbi:MAG: hypothetical protein QM731_24285 [Chitinophagaceae bacterium]